MLNTKIYKIKIKIYKKMSNKLLCRSCAAIINKLSYCFISDASSYCFIFKAALNINN
jgi:hypothetical protein